MGDGIDRQDKNSSALQLHLKTGEVLICDFDRGFVAPEMVKRRPVVVISRTATHYRKLCTVVPLSTTRPHPVEGWHVKLSRNPLTDRLPAGHEFLAVDEVWAKCDMLYTVSFDRLSRPFQRVNGRRDYAQLRVRDVDLGAIYEGVRAYLPAVR